MKSKNISFVPFKERKPHQTVVKNWFSLITTLYHSKQLALTAFIGWVPINVDLVTHTLPIFFLYITTLDDKNIKYTYIMENQQYTLMIYL